MSSFSVNLRGPLAEWKILSSVLDCVDTPCTGRFGTCDACTLKDHVGTEHVPGGVRGESSPFTLGTCRGRDVRRQVDHGKRRETNRGGTTRDRVEVTKGSSD